MMILMNIRLLTAIATEGISPELLLDLGSCVTLQKLVLDSLYDFQNFIIIGRIGTRYFV
jgi:hypothetical protein